MVNYQDVFFIQEDHLTVTNAAVHEIETTTNVSIIKRQYRFPEKTKIQINKEIKEIEQRGIIRPSKSSWNAPVLCIPKKDLDAEGNKKYRIVVDFRALNLITKPFVYPIPLVDEILDSLSDSEFFTTIDLKSGFYQVDILQSWSLMGCDELLTKLDRCNSDPIVMTFWMTRVDVNCIVPG